MASNNDLQLVIRAVDQASATLKRVQGEVESISGRVDRLGKETTSTTKRFQSFGERFREATAGMAVLAASASVAVYGLIHQLNASVDASTRYQAALTGLTSVSRAFGQSSDRARAAAVRLSRDGLMDVTDAARGLKNLLASGFSLDQAVTLMERFKDSAAFGRQSALSFGQAIASATEGIKNGNSILVDNAGVTKNLSVILEEAGFSAQDLMRATTDASIRQALFNGILKETNPQLGDAARLSDSFAGAQARTGVQVENLQRQIGLALQPALLALLQAITPLITKVAQWIEQNPRLAATLVLATTAGLAVIAVLGSLAAAIGVVVIAFGSGAALIGAAIAVAVAAVVGFGVAVVMNFDRIKAKFFALPGVIQEALRTVGPALLAPFLGPFSIIIANIDRILSAIDRLKKGLGGLNGGKGWDWGTWKIPGFASGAENFAGGWAIVGERGPELVHLPKGADVYSNEESRQLAPGGVTINQTNNVYNQVDLEAANRKLGWDLANA